MMAGLGKSLIIIGLVIAAVGAVLTLSGKLPWLGRLPGDIYIKKEGFSFFFPITSCILLSALISLLLWLLRR
jgi:hypothetical protein